MRTMLRLTYHGFENLIHTSKLLQVKRTQMVANARFTIRACSYFFRPQRIVRNEVVARKDVRLKPEPSPESLE